MPPLIYRTLLGGIALLCAFTIGAQDLEETVATTQARLREDPVKVSGGLTLGGQYVSSGGGPQRYDNVDWGLQARVNFDVLGWSVPFSAFISDRNRLYNLPSYQFVGLSPSYRWVRLHLGDRSMDFNPYTFSNQNFRGAGAELTPGNWRISGFYGRLNRLQLSDFDARQSIGGSYRRMGAAAAVGYENDRFLLKFTAFRARDEVPDTLFTLAPSRQAPAKNVVGSFEGGVRVAKRLRLQTTVASSWLTDDVRAVAAPDSVAGGPPFGGNATSSRETAVRARLNYTRDRATYNLTYERLSPNYRSLGTLYLTPDRENVTVGTMTALAKGKVTVSLNGGLQRNNLADDRQRGQRRFIAQVAVNARATERLNLNLNLSSFNYTSRVRSFLDPTSNTDSLFLAQINRSGTLGLTWRRDPEAGPGAFNLHFTVQDAQSIQDEEITTYASRLYNTYIGYGGRLAGPGVDFQVQGLLAVNDAAERANRTYGPSLVLRRSIREGLLTLALTGSYSWVDYAGDDQDGRIFLSRLSGGYRLGESGALQANLQYSHRRSGEATPLDETLVSLQYAWNF